MAWSDEFDGTAIDPTKWTFDEGRWGRVELQCYQRQNAGVEGGNLVIEARKEPCSGKAYSSARVKTGGLHDWTYGMVEASIKIPEGQGLWPAFWMLGCAAFPTLWERRAVMDLPAIGEVSVLSLREELERFRRER